MQWIHNPSVLLVLLVVILVILIFVMISAIRLNNNANELINNQNDQIQDLLRNNRRLLNRVSRLKQKRTLQ
jgi:predicted PurR-regulated permease PerM